MNPNGIPKTALGATAPAVAFHAAAAPAVSANAGTDVTNAAAARDADVTNAVAARDADRHLHPGKATS